MHEGHRRRFTNKVLYPEGLYDHELLEVLLYNVCPRIDLNDCAHRLMDKFGSLSGVFSAPLSALCEVYGVGRNTAEYLHCLGECLKSMVGGYSFGVLDTTVQFRDFLAMRHGGEEGAVIYILDKETRIRRIYIGAVAKTTCAFVITMLAACGAYGIFAARVRGGEALPCGGDDDLCKNIVEACRACGVKLHDFCIFSTDGGGFYSYFVADRLSVNRD